MKKTRKVRLVDNSKRIAEISSHLRKKLRFEKMHAKSMEEHRISHKDINLQRIKNTLKYGKDFIRKFPAIQINKGSLTRFSVGAISLGEGEGIGIAIEVVNKFGKKKDPKRIADATLLFEKESVNVTLQGTKRAGKKLKKFRKKTGIYWTLFLLEKIEETARETGFKSVKILVPEEMADYKYAHDYDAHPSYWHKADDHPDVQRIRSSIKNLVGAAANKRKFKREGKYYVKKL